MRPQRLALAIIVTAAVVASLAGCSSSSSAASSKLCTEAQIKALNPHDIVSVTTKALPKKLPAEFSTALSGRSDIVCAAYAHITYRASGGIYNFDTAILDSPIDGTVKQLNKTLVAKLHVKPAAGNSWDGPSGSQTGGLQAYQLGKKQTLVSSGVSAG